MEKEKGVCRMLSEYNIILGSGGFGLIVKHDNLDIVLKLLYNEKCSAAQVEYEKQDDIYNIFSHLGDNQICVSEPLLFNIESVCFIGKKFSCFYAMTLLHSLDDRGLIHIINNDYKNHIDKIVGRIYSEPISDINPSRGFFASYSYIEENILPTLSEVFKGYLNSIERIIEEMAFCFGLIAFVAEYFPKDVEYCLGKKIAYKGEKLCLCVLDFGMVEKICFNPDFIVEDQKFKKLNQIAHTLETNISLDIYFSDEYYSYIKKGLARAFELSDQTENKKYVYDRFIELLV